jgi:hypothetical protein
MIGPPNDAGTVKVDGLAGKITCSACGKKQLGYNTFRGVLGYTTPGFVRIGRLED